MDKFLKNLKLSLLIILGGLIVPGLLSIVFSGFRVNVVSIVSFEFFVGIIIAIIGGVLIAYDYSVFRRKVFTTPTDREVETNEDTEKNDWSHILFFSGAAIVLAAIALGEIL